MSDGYEIWSVPGKSVSVHVRTRVAGQIRALANDSANQTSECGGILWGRIRDAGDGYYLVSIEDASRVACEHARGEGWALSDNDPAVGFYRALGGRAVARSSEKFGAKSLDKVAFGWQN